MAVTGPDAPSPALRDQIAAALIAELVTCDTAEVVDAVLPVVTAAITAARREYDRQEVLVEDSWFARGDLPKILGNFMRAADRNGQAAKAAEVKLCEIRDLIQALAASRANQAFMNRLVERIETDRHLLDRIAAGRASERPLDDPLAQRIRQALYDEAATWGEDFDGGPGAVVSVADAAVVAARFMHSAGPSTASHPEPAAGDARLLELIEWYDGAQDIANDTAAALRHYRELLGDLPRECQVCGCTDDHACEGGCQWSDRNPELCTTCEDALDELVDANTPTPGDDTAGQPAPQPAAGVNATSEAMDGHDGTTRPSRTSAGSGTTFVHEAGDR